ncbi:MAG: PA2778 family cysteine peptidase [Candidatus Hydrogenedentota bacterium]
MVLATLAGCATGPRLATPGAMDVAERAYLEDVPFHAQRDYQCGPAALAMALNASGVNVSPDALVSQVFLPGRQGSVQPEMLAAARRHNRLSFVLDGEFESLLRELNAGNPVIVLQNLSLGLWPMWHYAVAVGYDLDTNRLLLHSGEEANRSISFRRFDATWARSDRWAMVALPPGELPAAIEPDRAMDAILAFEQANSAEAALPAWRAMMQRWPRVAMGWFALGNAEHAAGNPREAASAFSQATDEDRELAAAWLNLGLVLEELEEYDEARHALEQAASLPSRWRDKAEEALTRLDK